MKTIERYVFGSFLTSFFLAFFVLSFVLTIGLMVQIVGFILQGISMSLIGRFALVSFPETMQWTIPLGLLVASVLVFSRLSADSEVAAMRACGVNVLTVMRWPIMFAVFCTLLGLYINNEICPRGHEIRRDLTRRVNIGAGLEVLEPGRIIDDFPKAKIYFEAKEGNWLKDLIVYDYSSPNLSRTITASKALVQGDGRDVCLDLHDMTVDPLDREHPGMAHAARFQYRVKDALKAGKYKRKDRDFRFHEMLSAIKERDAAVSAAKKDVAAGVENAKKFLKMRRRAASDIKTEFQQRFVFAMASICFVLVGVPLGIKAQRKESSIGMAVSLAVALVYYLIVILMQSNAKNYAMHPEIFIWLPVVLCCALAAYLIPKNL